ncbi:sodium/hydrogen exchanger 10-like isoform X2 [Gigantopelta aegis]|uniref:sodium/hydrogen exchanger 10-like isoform X2 n=1 Tax=Gigantopelta aegis TaxID=1735272 RepID=UPI001B8896C9|nr:sodium/hydrogen exchanger 10-like isoform X2 [Gigantopelta aegis]
MDLNLTIDTNFTNTTHENETDHATGERKSHNIVLILFVFGSCAIGAAVRQLVCIIKPKLPYTVVLLLLGVVLGVGSRSIHAVERYLTSHIAAADPHIILFVFLPVLIFESAFAMEYHTFKKSFFQVLILALPGLALAAFLTCILCVQMFNYEWDWIIGMMFGSILSATDPVAVVAILRETGASKQLAMVTEGESLFNDGAAIVLFNVFFDLAVKSGGTSAGAIIINFLRVAVGGPAFGFLMAEITIFWLSNIFNDTIGEITITLSSTYLTFYIAEEFCEISGVLAVVVLGIIIGSKKTCISPEVELFLHRFWEMLAYLANTLIFILVGVVISDRALFKVHGVDWFYLVALYFGINVIRGIVIALLSPILIRIGYGMPWRDAIVMTWGGLRGAVGLALALIVVESEQLELEKIRIKVFIHVCGIVFLTLMINATTITYLLQVLGMRDISQAKKMAMDSALRFLEEQQQKTLNVLKTDRFLADADWEEVVKTCEIGDPYHSSKDELLVTSDSLDIRPDLTCPECQCYLPSQPTKKELLEMTNEAILRILKAEKLSYWRQFEQGMLSRDALQKLDECTEVATDKPGTFIDLEEVKSSWNVSRVLLKLKAVLKTGCRKRPVKLITQQKTFFQIIWQNISLAIVIHGIADAVLQFAVASQNDGTNKVVKITVLVMIVTRSIRLLRLVELMMPWMLLMVKRRIMMHLSYGFDLGRGFVIGEEEVRKLIDHVVDNKDIARQLKNRSDKNRLEVIRCLALLQKQHPDIALAVKTRQATRSVLNSLRDSAKKLCEEGILEDSEADKLQKMIEVKMKQLLNAPHSITPPTVDNVLRCAAWLQNDPDVIKFMKSRSQIVNYHFGETIMNQGESSNGICTIVFGLVRIEVSSPEQENKLVDFLTTGSIIGEMGLLTKKPRVASVRCETNVQMLFLSNEDMEEAMLKFAHLEPPLTYRLWKVCGVRLATGILMAQPEYHGLSIDKVKIRLENAYIVEVIETFFKDNTMSDIILINGTVEDTTGYEYKAPSYILSSVQSLHAVQEDGPIPILLVVPNIEFLLMTGRRESVSHAGRRGSARSALHVVDSRQKRFLAHPHPTDNTQADDKDNVGEMSNPSSERKTLPTETTDRRGVRPNERNKSNSNTVGISAAISDQHDVSSSNAMGLYGRAYGHSESCSRHRSSIRQDQVSILPTIYQGEWDDSFACYTEPMMQPGDPVLAASDKGAHLQGTSNSDGMEMKNRKAIVKSDQMENRHSKAKSKSSLAKFLLPSNRSHFKKTKAVNSSSDAKTNVTDGKSSSEIQLLSPVKSPTLDRSGEENTSFVEESSHM